jgi:hypothetical protein
MTVVLHPRAGSVRPLRPRHLQISARPSRFGYWTAAAIVVVGVVVALGLGLASYRDAQRELHAVRSVQIPGTLRVELQGSSRQVIYYAGGRVDPAALTFVVTDPRGAVVAVSTYEGDVTDQTLDLTRARAIASFHTTATGVYRVQVSGDAAGLLVVGDGASTLARDGVIAALFLADAAVVAGFVVWLCAYLDRSGRRRR